MHRTDVGEFNLLSFLPKGSTASFDLTQTELLPPLPFPPVPPPFPGPPPTPPPTGDTCEESCKGLPTVAFFACMAQCKSTGKSTERGPFKFPSLTGEIQQILVLLFAAIILIIGLALIIR